MFFERALRRFPWTPSAAKIRDQCNHCGQVLWNCSSPIMSTECELFPQSKPRLWILDASLGRGSSLSPELFCIPLSTPPPPWGVSYPRQES